MIEKQIKAFRKYEALLNQQQFDKTTLDYSILDRHIPMLERLDVIDSSSITIFDLYRREHIYISSNFEKILGYSIKAAENEGTDYFNRHIHRGDLLFLTEAGTYFMELFFKVDSEEVRNHKLITDYRMYKSDGTVIRVIEQQLCLELDQQGNLWLALSFLDISPDQDLLTPARARLLNFKSGRLFHFPPDRGKIPLTHREKEILTLLAEGMISKQIADKLFISVNTVNTHRQRILEKLKAGNTAEAIRYGREQGIL